MRDVAQLIAAVKSSDSALAEPASRDLRKLAISDPSSVQSLSKDILNLVMVCPDLRIRGNLIIVLGELPFSRVQRAAAVDWLLERVCDASPLTRTFALQSLMDLSAKDPSLRRRVLTIAAEFAENGTAAMRARARKLLKSAQT